jgi:hypothetical protein
MKSLILFSLLLSFSSLAQTARLNLSAKDSVNVICPKGNVAELRGSILKCGCPEDTYSNYIGNRLTCESLCEITEEIVSVAGDSYCDQGGCFTSSKQVKILVLKTKAKRDLLFQEQIYSPRKLDLEMFLDQALEVAKKECFKTLYKGQYL